MQITFLLGNGFDRAIGLETSYSSFYEWYVKQSKEGLPSWVAEFRDEINKYVKKDTDAEVYWADAEDGLAQYTDKFSLETVEQFYDCYDDFRDNLIAYLKDQEKLFSSESAAQARDCLKSQLANFFQEIDPVEMGSVNETRKEDAAFASDVNFISFNYTDAVDKVFNALRPITLGEWVRGNSSPNRLRMGKLIHVHGTLEQWPIIGVCDIKNVKNEVLRENAEFREIMQKKESIRVGGQLWRQEATDIINKSTFICVFGMSIGETDSDYWELLAKWLMENRRHHLIIYWFDVNSKNVNTSIREKRKALAGVRDKIWKYASLTEENYQPFIQRIHIVIKPQKMFALPESCKVKQPVRMDDERKQLQADEVYVFDGGEASGHAVK